MTPLLSSMFSLKNPFKKTKPLTIVIVIVVILMVGLYIANIVAHLTVTERERRELLTWNGVMIGTTTESQLLSTMGTPLAKRQVNGATEYDYQSSFPVYPHNVDIKNNTVSFIREWVDPNITININEQIQKLGQPEGAYPSADIGDGFTLYAYSAKGVAYIVHDGSGRIFHILRFTPRPITQFVTDFASSIRTEAPGPE